MSETVKCKRCSYSWLPCGTRELPVNGNLYMVDLGICQRCHSHTSRVHVATPGDMVNAEIWGQRFELKRVIDES